MNGTSRQIMDRLGPLEMGYRDRPRAWPDIDTTAAKFWVGSLACDYIDDLTPTPTTPTPTPTPTPNASTTHCGGTIPRPTASRLGRYIVSGPCSIIAPRFEAV